MPYVITEIQATPNPNATKFVLDRAISDAPTSFLNADEATGHPIAKRLFAIAGVSSVLLLGDFVTVNKQPGVGWGAIRRKIQQVLAEV